VSLDPELQSQIESARTAALACHTLTVELVAIVEALRDIKNDLRGVALALQDEVQEDTDFLLDF